LRWQYKPFGTEQWELFNVAKDVAERHDLAAQEPEKVKALVSLWDDYARANNVILPDRVISEGMVKKMPDRYPVEAGYPPLIYKKQFVPPADMMSDPKE
jgi:arylsulfatase